MSPTAVFSHRDLNDLKTNTFVMTISNAYIRSVRLEYARSEILATHHLHTHIKVHFLPCNCLLHHVEDYAMTLILALSLLVSSDSYHHNKASEINMY
jgi:hypothetical protein